MGLASRAYDRDSEQASFFRFSPDEKVKALTEDAETEKIALIGMGDIISPNYREYVTAQVIDRSKKAKSVKELDSIYRDYVQIGIICGRKPYEIIAGLMCNQDVNDKLGYDIFKGVARKAFVDNKLKVGDREMSRLLDELKQASAAYYATKEKTGSDVSMFKKLNDSIAALKSIFDFIKPAAVEEPDKAATDVAADADNKTTSDEKQDEKPDKKEPVEGKKPETGSKHKQHKKPQNLDASPIEAPAAARSLGFNINNFVNTPSNAPSQQPVQQAVQMPIPQQQNIALPGPQAGNLQNVINKATIPTAQPQTIPADKVNPVGQFIKRAEDKKPPIDPSVIMQQHFNTPVQQSVAQKPNGSIIYPEGYDKMTPQQKCDVIRSIVASSNGQIKPVYDPMRGQSVEKKIEELKKHIVFISGVHSGDNAIDEIQLVGMLSLINAPYLRTKMTELGAKDRPNNPKLYEVPIEKYAAKNPDGKFDMAFEMNTKDKKKKIVIMYRSVPSYNHTTKSWNNAADFSTARIKTQPSEEAQSPKEA